MRKFVNSTMMVLAIALLVGPAGTTSVTASAPPSQVINAAEHERDTAADNGTSRSFDRHTSCLRDEDCLTSKPVAATEPPSMCPKNVNKVWAGPCPPAPSKAEINAIQRKLLAEWGWGTDAQFNCHSQLINGESSWNVYAVNPRSKAYGLPQSLPGNKMASAGDDWGWNPVTQLRWQMGYIERRYGSPCKAWGFWQAQSPHWY